MCGIAGVLERGGAGSAELLATAERMAQALFHRGPDGGGTWSDGERVAFGHRRLAIIDLAPTGRQPMASASGRLHIVFNGEIYNYRALRDELQTEGVAFRGGGDTEILVEACERWGVRRALDRARGMYAFALWDAAARVLTLARDPLGIKPLFWARTGSRILFASQMKGMLAVGRGAFGVDRQALAAYAALGYAPGESTVLAGVRKVAPGAVLRIDADGRATAESFHEPPPFALRPARDPQEGLDAFEAALEDSVRLHLVADVPVGAFLSGGIDSSAVAAAMCRVGSGRPRTFTIGFGEGEFDEAPHARRVAEALGTDHTEVILAPDEAVGLAADMGRWFDEPFADSSALPTMLVSMVTREHVAVALSGDGGDELFAGYERYAWMSRHAALLGRIPAPLRRAAAAMLARAPASAWDALVPASLRGRLSGDRLRKLAPMLAAGSPVEVYRRLVGYWMPEEPVLAGAGRPDFGALTLDEGLPLVQALQALDMRTYLPDDILVKLDRASMAASLEARVPLVDPSVLAAARAVPVGLYEAGGLSKWPLRRYAYKHIPRDLLERPKMGFAVPLAQWLRGPLRPLVEDVLSRESLRTTGLFDPDIVARYVAEHMSGGRNWHHRLWAVLAAEQWARAWLMGGVGREAERPARRLAA